MLKKANNHIYIPISEIRISFARSSGAGGQNVNKTSTKVIIYWSISDSRALTEEEKIRIRTKLANRINSHDELMVVSEEERSQFQNRALAFSRLQSIIAEALQVQKKRQPIRPSRASKLKWIEFKRMRSRLKESRKVLE
jgi:ribosome-associated protein